MRAADAAKHSFAGVHIFTASVDIPDDYRKGPRLVVLPPESLCAFTREDGKNAYTAAEEILRNRGEQPRQKQNRLIFAAADFDALSRLKDHARTYIAWSEILSDIDNGKLNLDLFQINQVKQQRETSERSLNQILKETYKWKNKLKEEEWLITQWSPIHLRNLLHQWYFKDGKTEVSAARVWQDSCSYLYFPRLLNEDVFCNAVEKGLESEDYFGFASGKDGDAFLGFNFGKGGRVNLDDAALLIERETAAAYRDQIMEAPSTPAPGVTDENKDPGVLEKSGDSNFVENPMPGDASTTGVTPPLSTIKKKQFYGSINIDPVKSKMDFAMIVDEVVQQFTTKLGIDVDIFVEIKAKSTEGFDESLQRTIKENCSVLRFQNSEFEE